MRILKAEFPKETEYIELYPISDLHIGDKEFDEEEFLKLMSYIQNKDNAYAILLGDIINNGIKSSVTNVYTEIMPPSKQKKKAVELLGPIKHKILAITDGNHELRSQKEVDNNITYDIACLLGIEDKYTEGDIKLKIILGQQKNGKPSTYNIYATHGFSGGKRVGGVLNNLELLGVNYENVDLYVVGHAHKKAVYKNRVFYFDDRHEKITAKDRYFVLTSSFTNYSEYAKRKGLIPSSLGTVKIILNGKDKKIEVVIWIL